MSEARVVCPNGASVRPTKGNALDMTSTKSRSFGPTAQSFTSKKNGWPVGPEIVVSFGPHNQGFALRWGNGWAFGPQIGRRAKREPRRHNRSRIE